MLNLDAQFVRLILFVADGLRKRRKIIFSNIIIIDERRPNFQKDLEGFVNSL